MSVESGLFVVPMSLGYNNLMSLMIIFLLVTWSDFTSLISLQVFTVHFLHHFSGFMLAQDITQFEM